MQIDRRYEIMANMSLKKTPIGEQDPKVRARNFKEVSLLSLIHI